MILSLKALPLVVNRQPLILTVNVAYLLHRLVVLVTINI